MANADLKNVIMGPVAAYIGATKIPNITDEDVSLTIEGKRVEFKSNEFGDAIRKLFIAGMTGTLSLTFSAEHKPLLSRIYNWIEAEGINPATPQAGKLLIKSKNGACIKPYTITVYLKYKDCDTQVTYGADENNPISFQIKYAFSPSMIDWIMNTDSPLTHTAEFTIGPDEDNDSLMVQVGSNALPLAGLVHAVVTAAGSYTVAPSAVVGTQWAATTAYTVGQQIFSGDNLYTVTEAGTSGSSAPTHTSGAVANGTAELTYAGKAAKVSLELVGTGIKATITESGFGYTAAPAISLTGGTGTGGAITGYIG